MNKNTRRGVLLPIFAISLMIMNMTRLKGSECIRPIHVVTLVVMGFALGVLVMNLITMYRNNQIRKGTD